jgi:hypothetical protein
MHTQILYEGKTEERLGETVTVWRAVLRAIWRTVNRMCSWPLYWTQLALVITLFIL